MRPSTHRERLWAAALRLKDKGRPIPVDFQARLLALGVDLSVNLNPPTCGGDMKDR